MKEPNGFDELARRKLAERDHAFDPSHWSDMERLLAERERKPKTWWPWMAAGVLLLGGAVLWSVTDEKAASVATPSSEVAPQVDGSTTTPETTATVAVAAPTKAAPEASPGKRAVAEAVHAPGTDPASAGRTDVARLRPTVAPPRDTHVAAVPVSASATIDAGIAQPTMVTLTESALPDDTPALTEPEPDDYPAVPTNDPAVAIASITAAPEDPEAANPDVVDMAEPKADPENAIIPEPVQQPLEPTNEPNTFSLVPSAVVPAPPVANTVEPSAAPPGPPAWLALRTPVELSLLGGLFSTTGEYRGDGTETWKESTERESTMGFGIEGVWNIGAHFGLGVGAHYSSYKERLMTSELSRTDELLSNSYFWVQHDTMVLTVVGDTTIGATTYIITELVPVTINELGIDTDTSYSTTLLRQRRSTTNAVNYIEVPLLLDAHTSCGRWVFGVRGGPTVGLLTSKEGSIPGDNETGYADLNEQTFRSMTLGATARLYARYRLSGAWAIGLEPTWRQQLGNAFGDADVQRRGNAFGGYLSLSYRFAAKSVVP